MNKTFQSECFSLEFEISAIPSTNLAALAVCNTTLMIVNVITNAFVMFILIKTEQISSVTCKLIFMLSLSDFMIAIFVQNLFTATLYIMHCLLKVVSLISTAFLMHLSMYVVAVIGVDRYVRIKYYTNFKRIWTTKIVFTLIFIGFSLALFQAVVVTMAFILRKPRIGTLTYIAMDCMIIGIILWLQIQTIRTSNAIHSESTVSTLEKINRKISKLSMRIMILLFLFYAPCFIVLVIVRYFIIHRVNGNEKLKLEFFSCLSMVFAFGNCSANAILFLMTNVKAKRLLRNLIRERRVSFQSTERT